jgi:5,10-methenyltetrahydrofolate synthetase
VDGQVVDPQTWADVSVFRRAERARLYALRKAMSVAEQTAMAETIGRALTEMLGKIEGKTIAAYWPIKGELDLRDWMAACVNRGATVGLPVVTQKSRPVEFHRWTPQHQMTRGFWNIPVPEVTETVTPDVVIVPLLGVDRQGYRLGNGGGYYDRTLALLPKALRIGVGQPFANIETIFPMPWDIAMQRIVLGSVERGEPRPTTL